MELATFSVAVTAAVAAVSAAPIRPSSAENAQFFPSQLNLAVPASPALDVLGVSNSEVKPTSNLQELVAGLVNSFDSGGHLKQGFAFAGTLSNFGISSKKVQSKRYLSDPGTRLHWATNLSFAAVKGSDSADPSARASVGVTFPIIDDTDWRKYPEARKIYSAAVSGVFSEAAPEAASGADLAYLLKQVPKIEAVLSLADSQGNQKAKTDAQAALDAIELFRSDAQETSRKAAVTAINQLNERQRGTPSDFVAVTSAAHKADLEKCKADFVQKQNKLYWNRRKFDISAAHTWFAADASKDDLTPDGTYLWADFSDSLGDNGRYTLFGRYANHDRSFDQDAKVWNVGNSRSYGASARFGSEAKGFFIQYMETINDVDGGASTTNKVFQGGFELAIGNSQWLQIAFGRGDGPGVSKNLFGINWSFNVSSGRELKISP